MAAKIFLFYFRFFLEYIHWQIFQSTTEPLGTFLACFGAEIIEQLCLDELLKSDLFEVRGSILLFVHCCVKLINLIVLYVYEVGFIGLSVELELKVGFVQEKDVNFIAIIMIHRLTHGFSTR